MAIENNLRDLRSEEDLTQGELGKKIGVSRQTVNAIETGKYNPSLELAFQLSNFFDIAVEEIFRLED